MEFRLKRDKESYIWLDCQCGLKFPVNPSKRKKFVYCPKCGAKTDMKREIKV